MKRLFCFLILFARLPGAETVELSAAHPRNADKTGTLRIERVEAAVTQRGALAETQATLLLAMDADPALKMEGRLVFALPPDCVVTGAALDIGEIMRPASVTFKEVAKAAYDAVVSRMLDPCLVQLLPDGRVSVQVFPFTGGKPRKLRLEFAHLLPPGTGWEFPLKFAAPVPADLMTDAPGQKSVAERADFSGGAEWRILAPPAGDGPLRAHPDGAGRFVFQTLLPAGEPSPPPRHLLLVADVSLLQAGRDAAAERALLERLFQKMQSGRLTLVTFSTALHSEAEYAVQDGKCDAALAALAALAYDGAPRPGAVDVSGIPADLTLVISTLAAPMGGGHIPKLPPAAPVWVMDSVSRAPSAVAARLAAETGGMAFDPRQPVELVFQPRLALAEKGVTGITARTLPGGLWRLVCGELTGETGEVTVMGRRLSITKGGDAAAGRLTGKFLAREHFTQLAAESDARVRKELRTDPQCAPFLTAATAFIVLEEEWQYKQFGIPLPPDLTRDVRTSDGAQERSEREGFVEFDRALRRPAGTAGDPAEWHSRVRSHSKRAELSTLFGNRSRFEERRQTFGTLPPHISWVAEDAAYLEAVKKARQAGLELSRLSRAYQDAPTSQAEQLIRTGRAQQQAAMQRTELLTEYFEIGLLRSGGAPGADPFGGPAEMAELNTRAADPFASADVGTGGGPGGGTASAEPFGPPPAPPAIVPPAAAPAPAPSETPAAPPPPSSSTPQVPQTFGGSGGWPWGGDIFADGRSGPAANQTSGAGAEHSARQARAAYKDAALARATALHRDGKIPEAIRALSRLALPGQNDHGLLRLLAWVLQEWGEHALALEVLEQAERRFGASDTTARDLGLALLAAGRKDEALRQFRRASHHVARRDAAGLDGRMSAALRVVVECADANADADLEIAGPDYELCNWRNPLPAFGGALSFDGKGEAPEDFVLPALPAESLRFRVRLDQPAAVRVTVIENWGREGESSRVLFFPAGKAGVISVSEFGRK